MDCQLMNDEMRQRGLSSTHRSKCKINVIPSPRITVLGFKISSHSTPTLYIGGINCGQCGALNFACKSVNPRRGRFFTAHDCSNEKCQESHYHINFNTGFLQNLVIVEGILFPNGTVLICFCQFLGMIQVLRHARWCSRIIILWGDCCLVRSCFGEQDNHIKVIKHYVYLSKNLLR